MGSIPGNPLSSLPWYCPKRKVLDLLSPSPPLTQPVLEPLQLISRPADALMIIVIAKQVTQSKLDVLYIDDKMVEKMTTLGSVVCRLNVDS